MDRFLIICAGWNCSGLVGKCFWSVFNQDVHFKCVMISDASSDGTDHEVSILPTDGRFAYHINKDNVGAAKNRWEAIKNHGEPGDVVVFLGLDDELLANALSRIKQEYDKGMWMTYGNWINQKKKVNGMVLEFDEVTHEKRDYRKVKYRSTAPNTFKIELFNKIRKEDFMINGVWMDTTSESPVMFACLEMCGKDRIGIIKEPIYMYNQYRRMGTQIQQGSAYKKEILGKVMQLRKYPIYEDC